MIGSAIVLLALAQAPVPIPIAPMTRKETVDFQSEVLPVLQKKCLACHNKGQARGDVVLETPASILEGGKNGAVVLPGKGTESLLIHVASQSSKPPMPPANNKVGASPMTSEELGLVSLWIDQGAKGEVKAAAAKIVWHPLPPGVNPIYSIALSPDGRVAACGRANQVFVYNLAAGGAATRLTDPTLIESGLYSKPGVADPDGIQSLAFDPAGGIIASGGYRTVKLWRRPKGPRALELAGATAPLASLAISPDGKRAAAGAQDGRILIWDLDGGKAARPLAAHAASVTGLAFTDDGTRLVSASLDGSIAAWGAADGFPLGRASVASPANAIALAQKSAQAAVACADGVVRVFVLAKDAATEPALAPAPVPELKGHAKAVTCLAALPAGGAKLLSGSEDGTVRQWDLASGKEEKQVAHGGPVAAVAARPDGQAFASAGLDKAAKLWNAADGKLIAEEKGDPEAAFAAREREREANYFTGIATNEKNALTAADKALAEAKKKAEGSQAALAKLVADQKAEADKAAQAGNTQADAQKKAQEAEAARKKAEEAAKAEADAVKTAEGAAGAAKGRAEHAEADQKAAQAALEAAKQVAAAREQPLRALAFSADGATFAVAGEDGIVRVFGAKSGAFVDAIEGAHGAVTAAAFVAGRGLVTAAFDKTAGVWDLATAWPLARTIGSVDDTSAFIDRVTALAFSPDGAFIATGGGEPSRSGEVKVWKVADGSLVQTFASAHSDVVFGIEFSPDGKLLATGSADKFVKVFEIATGKLVKSFEGHTHHVLGVSWRSDGKLLASAGADGVIKTWSLDTGEQVRTIGGFGKQVTGVKFIRFSSQVVSSCGDRTARLHNTDDGGNPRNFGGATDYLYAVAATPDGKVVAAGGHSSVLHVWDGTNAQVIATLPPPDEKK